MRTRLNAAAACMLVLRADYCRSIRGHRVRIKCSRIIGDGGTISTRSNEIERVGETLF